MDSWNGHGDFEQWLGHGDARTTCKLEGGDSNEAEKGHMKTITYLFS
jgi:hypothetical protein